MLLIWPWNYIILPLIRYIDTNSVFHGHKLQSCLESFAFITRHAALVLVIVACGLAYYRSVKSTSDCHITDHHELLLHKESVDHELELEQELDMASNCRPAAYTKGPTLELQDTNFIFNSCPEVTAANKILATVIKDSTQDLLVNPHTMPTASTAQKGKHPPVSAAFAQSVNTTAATKKSTIGTVNTTKKTLQKDHVCNKPDSVAKSNPISIAARSPGFRAPSTLPGVNLSKSSQPKKKSAVSALPSRSKCSTEKESSAKSYVAHTPKATVAIPGHAHTIQSTPVTNTDSSIASASNIRHKTASNISDSTSHIASPQVKVLSSALAQSYGAKLASFTSTAAAQSALTAASRKAAAVEYSNALRNRKLSAPSAQTSARASSLVSDSSIKPTLSNPSHLDSKSTPTSPKKSTHSRPILKSASTPSTPSIKNSILVAPPTTSTPNISARIALFNKLTSSPDNSNNTGLNQHKTTSIQTSNVTEQVNDGKSVMPSSSESAQVKSVNAIPESKRAPSPDHSDKTEMAASTRVQTIITSTESPSVSLHANSTTQQQKCTDSVPSVKLTIVQLEHIFPKESSSDPASVEENASTPWLTRPRCSSDNSTLSTTSLLTSSQSVGPYSSNLSDFTTDSQVTLYGGTLVDLNDIPCSKQQFELNHSAEMDSPSFKSNVQLAELLIESIDSQHTLSVLESVQLFSQSSKTVSSLPNAELPKSKQSSLKEPLIYKKQSEILPSVSDTTVSECFAKPIDIQDVAFTEKACNREEPGIIFVSHQRIPSQRFQLPSSSSHSLTQSKSMSSVSVMAPIDSSKVALPSSATTTAVPDTLLPITSNETVQNPESIEPKQTFLSKEPFETTRSSLHQRPVRHRVLSTDSQLYPIHGDTLQQNRGRQRCVTDSVKGRNRSLSPLSASVSDSFVRNLFADLSNDTRLADYTSNNSRGPLGLVKSTGGCLDMRLDIGFDLVLGGGSKLTLQDEPLQVLPVSYISGNLPNIKNTKDNQPGNELEHKTLSLECVDDKLPFGLNSIAIPADHLQPQQSQQSNPYILSKQLDQPIVSSHQAYTNSPDCYLNSQSLVYFPCALLPNITRLVLDNNSIRFIPESALDSLTSLRVFSLAKNQLSRLPQSIWQLKSLERLCLRDNCLEELPVGLCELKSIRILDLGMNQLSQIDCKLFLHMNMLHTLILSNNLLQHLPSSLGYLAPNLRILYIFNNPFAYPFNELVEPVIRCFSNQLPTPEKLWSAPLSDTLRSSVENSLAKDMSFTSCAMVCNDSKSKNNSMGTVTLQAVDTLFPKTVYPRHGYLLRLLGFLRDEFDLCTDVSTIESNYPLLFESSLPTLSVDCKRWSAESSMLSNSSTLITQSLKSEDDTLQPLPIQMSPMSRPPAQFLASPTSPNIGLSEKCSRIITEILTTEKTYVDELTNLHELYYQPLCNSKLMENHEIELIFSTVFEPIFVFHRDHVFPCLKLLAQSEAYKLGEFLASICEFLLDYYSVYMNNFSLSSAYLKHLEDLGTQSGKGLTGLLGSGGNGGLRGMGTGNNTNSGVSNMLASLGSMTTSSTSKKTFLAARKCVAFFKQVKLDPRHTQISFGSYLVMPIQRLMRYTMLLESLAKAAGSDANGYEVLVGAVDEMRRTAETCNERKREWERVGSSEHDCVRRVRQHIKIRPGSIDVELLSRSVACPSSDPASFGLSKLLRVLYSSIPSIPACMYISLSPPRRLIQISASADLRVIKYVEPNTTPQPLDLTIITRGKTATSSKHRQSVCHATREYRFNTTMHPAVGSASVYNGFADTAHARTARDIEFGGAVGIYGVPMTTGKRCMLVVFSDIVCWCMPSTNATPPSFDELTRFEIETGSTMELVKVFGGGGDKRLKVTAECLPVLDGDARLNEKYSIMRLGDDRGVLYVKGVTSEIISWVDAIHRMD
ncbi:hypothetical protein BDV3_005718 [Batrachochytrium dendrobatidis]